jgi:tetratricopeptide (TPR) repeat protein
MGKVYQASANLEMALKNYINAEKSYYQTGDPLTYANALDDIAYLEGLLGNFQKTIEYVDKAARVYIDLDNKPLLARAYETLGAGNAMLDKKDVAESYFKKSLKIAEEGNLLGPQAQALQHLGGLKVEAGAFEAGIALQKKALNCANW